MADFAVWVPQRDRVRVQVDGVTHAMARDGAGWWRAAVEAATGARYAFLLDDDPTPLPDPRSLRQPDGVHGASQLYDHASFFWTDRSWTGRHLPGSVLYELHVGTFTEAGTFDTAIGRLDHLAELGVDLVEVLPVNAVDGPRNWGYDGVGWYAVTENYGGPDAFKRLRRRLPRCAGSAWCSTSSTTTSGPRAPISTASAPTSRAATSGARRSTSTARLSEPVRRYVVDNALMWLRDFHVDGLRIDAVHALRDDPRDPCAGAAGDRGRGAVGARADGRWR